MKRVLTLTVACMVTLLSFADDHPRDGRLRISNQSRHDIFVMIDGRVVRDRGNQLMIAGLSPGRHMIQVYRKNHRGRRERQILLYRNAVHVSPGEELRMLVLRDGRVWVDEKRRNDRRYYDGDRRYDRNRDGRHYYGDRNDRRYDHHDRK